MGELTGTVIEPEKCSLFGILGEFTVGNNPQWKIMHFNTKASKEANGDAGNTLRLLRELKPMRDRVLSNQIHDMTSLLQRDLDDYRVAHDLIPYLINNISGIGFFPGVLVALMPKGFLNNSNESEVTQESGYPKRAQINESEYGYGDCWTVEKYSIGGKKTAFGKLNIFTEKADLVVLDGQHRANAFRYVTGTFGNGMTNNQVDIYKGFYEEAGPPPNNFQAELPVTIVWFESLVEGVSLMPQIISRKLFVDVNTNAKPVNDSRNYLLDDRKIAAICTQGFYSKAAASGFATDKLSLVCSAFDSDDSVESFANIFSPAKMFYAFCYLALAKDECDGLDWKPTRDYYGAQNNVDRLLRIMGNGRDVPKRKALQCGTFENKKLVDAVSRSIANFVYLAFDEFVLVKRHLQGLSSVKQGLQGTVQNEIWDKIYCGGEGLYYSFKSAEKRGSANHTLRSYIEGINEVEEKIKKERAKLFSASASDVLKAYETFSSKASITGFLMALSRHTQMNGWSEKSIKDFVEILNKTSADQWIAIFSQMKPAIMGDLEPKSWPKMRNVILRVLQNNGGGEFFK